MFRDCTETCGCSGTGLRPADIQGLDRDLRMFRDWTETCGVECIKFLLYKDKISAKLNLSSFTYMLSTQKET